MQLIGLCGRGTINGEFASTARVGKDEVARVLEQDLGYQVQPFALPLKQSLQMILGLSTDQTWGDAFKTQPVDVWNSVPYRTLLQRWGTEGFRQHLDRDFWVKRAFLAIDHAKNGVMQDYLSRTPQPDAETPANLRGAEALKRGLCIALGVSGAELLSHWERPLPYWGFTGSFAYTTLVQKILPSTLLHQTLTTNSETSAFAAGFHRTRNQLPLFHSVGFGPYSAPSAQPTGVVIPDVRFPNEAEAVRQHGGVLHVMRELPPGIEVVAGHTSEQGIPVEVNDLLVQNNGSLDELKHKVVAVVAGFSNLTGGTYTC